MSERRRMRFHFHAQTNGPPTSRIGRPMTDLEPIKHPDSHENSATFCEGRRSGFPSSMFQRGDKNNAGPDPPIITDGGWVRPSPTGWTLPPDKPLEPIVKNSNTSATNIRRSPAEIGAGDGYKFGWGSGLAFPGMKKATGVETIDSNEAAQKYG